MNEVTRVRAMFYVSAINRYGNCGQPGAEPKTSRISVSLAAVYGRTPDTEKYRFWKASPNGKADIGVLEENADYWKPGQAFYLDFLPVDGTETAELCYRLVERTERVDWQGHDPTRLNQITCKWSRVCEGAWSSIEITIDNQDVFDFHVVGKNYVVMFTPVEP